MDTVRAVIGWIIFLAFLVPYALLWLAILWPKDTTRYGDAIPPRPTREGV